MANFSATMVTSLPSVSVSLYLSLSPSLSLSQRVHLTHKMLSKLRKTGAGSATNQKKKKKKDKKSFIYVSLPCRQWQTKSSRQAMWPRTINQTLTFWTRGTYYFVMEIDAVPQTMYYYVLDLHGFNGPTQVSVVHDWTPTWTRGLAMSHCALRRKKECWKYLGSWSFECVRFRRFSAVLHEGCTATHQFRLEDVVQTYSSDIGSDNEHFLDDEILLVNLLMQHVQLLACWRITLTDNVRAEWNWSFFFAVPCYPEWQKPFRANLMVKKSLGKEILLILLSEFVCVQRKFKGRMKNDCKALMNLSSFLSYPAFLSWAMLQFTFLGLSFSFFLIYLQSSGRLKNLICPVSSKKQDVNAMTWDDCSDGLSAHFSKSFSIFQQHTLPQCIVSICAKTKGP